MNVLSPYDVDQDRNFRDGQRWPWIVLAVFVVLLIVAGGAWIWLQNQVDPSGGPGREVRIQVEEGMSVDQIGRLLERERVIESATVFRYYARLNGTDSIQAGQYTLRQRESMARVLDILGAGAKVQSIPLTVPEGLTLKEIADKVGELPGRSASRFLEVAGSGAVQSQYQPPGSTNLEGLLLPETYFLDPDDDETAILRRMVAAFDEAATSRGIVAAADRFRLTPYQTVIVASMVEREARVPDERGKVARVIYNRLDKGMQLQIDATVVYALGERRDVVLFADRDIDSPYNTYKIDGLPPGPIASPGTASLEAAFAPEPGPWLYYVLTDENGRHTFAATDAEFARALNEARAKGLAG